MKVSSPPTVASSATSAPVDPQPPAQRLWTERLRLEASHPVLAPAVSAFFLDNEAHLAPWGPPRPAGFWDVEPTQARLAQHTASFANSQLWQYWISRIDAPDQIIGQCQVSQVSRGVFQSASLGYGLAEAAQGQGYMREALRCLIDEVFSPQVWMHRLEAAVRPDNGPSLRVMRDLGFQEIGLCRDYLFINGAWRDHHLFALVNPDWPAGQGPVY